MTNTTAKAAIGFDKIPPVTTGDLPDQLTLRSDMPGVYSGRRFAGTVNIACHFRVTVTEAGAIHLEDDTEAVAQVLLDRARAKMEREERAARAQVARVGAKTPIEHRAARGDVVAEQTMKAGVNRSRALTSLGTLQQRHLLTMRQFEAGDRLAQDVKTMAGAREARDDAAPPEPTLDGRAWEDFAAIAGRQFNLAREVCMRLPWFEGVSPWSVVEDIVVRDLTLTEAAGGGTSRSVQRRFKVALRMGLDAIGDVYTIPAQLTRTNVLVNGIPVPMVTCEDIDGLDREENQRRLVRCVKLDGRLWPAVAENFRELYELAKKHVENEPRALPAVPSNISEGT